MWTEWKCMIHGCMEYLIPSFEEWVVLKVSKSTFTELNNFLFLIRSKLLFSGVFAEHLEGRIDLLSTNHANGLAASIGSRWWDTTVTSLICWFCLTYSPFIVLPKPDESIHPNKLHWLKSIIYIYLLFLYWVKNVNLFTEVEFEFQVSGNHVFLYLVPRKSRPGKLLTNNYGSR